MTQQTKLAILGTGNLGRAIAVGLTTYNGYKPQEIIVTRRKLEKLDDLKQQGFVVLADNCEAVRLCDTVIVAVEPKQLDGLLSQIGGSLDSDRHTLISVVSGATIADILRQAGKELTVVRAMPNTAITLGESMTCLSTNSKQPEVMENAVSLFNSVGQTLVIDEEMMVPATALCACGIAYFLRAIRAASQGGIEIGFHPQEALAITAQTALGAAALLRRKGLHPEREIDNVTTPRGCTISGLNEMEHRGFSSAMIKGIVISAEKAAGLYRNNG